VDLVTIVDDDKLINIDEKNLRKGDVVVLQAGDFSPADLKLIEARALEVDEFDLTGEIMPVVKDAETGDVIVYRGSKVLRGQGKGIVIATGEQTEHGKVLQQTWEPKQPCPPPVFKMKYLILACFLIPVLLLQIIRSDHPAFVVPLYGLLFAAVILLQNDALFKSWLVACQRRRLERLNIQVRDVSALERMDQVDTICFDKTGVLTTRRVEIKGIYLAGEDLSQVNPKQGEVSRLVNLGCALCHDVAFFEKRILADPADEALIAFAMRNGVDVEHMLRQARRVYELPFDSENRFMGCGFDLNGETIHFVKGDPAVLLGKCSHYLTRAGEKSRVDAMYWHSNHANIAAITQNGDSVLALACAFGDVKPRPGEFTFVCLLHLENTLQPDARTMIEWLTVRGIRSLMLTGDRAETALRIGKNCGIAFDSSVCLTGKMIEKMSLDEVSKQSTYCSIFARLTPSQKGILVIRLRQNGHRVAMVGDGPNDGIALRVADIGISFAKNSSPIARKLAKILVNNLTDLSRFIESSHWIQAGNRWLKALRLVLLVSLLAVPYAWIISALHMP